MLDIDDYSNLIHTYSIDLIKYIESQLPKVSA